MTETRSGYGQVRDDLRRRIGSGELVPGYPIPTREQLAAEYGVARGTVDQAVGDLEAEGLVRAVRRRGTVVLPPIERRRLVRLKRVGVDERGYYFDEIAQQWVPLGEPRQHYAAAPSDVAIALGVDLGSEVLVRDRAVGLLDAGRAEQLVTSYLPAALVRGTPVESTERGSGGVYERLERDLGLGPLRWVEAVSARMPTAAEARALGMSTRQPVLRVVRLTTDRGGRPVEVNDCRMSSARYEVAYPLDRAEVAAYG